jgi:hypothetical protein
MYKRHAIKGIAFIHIRDTNLYPEPRPMRRLPFFYETETLGNRRSDTMAVSVENYKEAAVECTGAKFSRKHTISE